MTTPNNKLNHPVFRLSKHLEVHVVSAELLERCQATQAKILQASEVHMTEAFFSSIKQSKSQKDYIKHIKSNPGYHITQENYAFVLDELMKITNYYTQSNQSATNTHVICIDWPRTEFINQTYSSSICGND